MDPVKKGAVLCSHCSLIAHSKCASRAPPTCDLRSKLLMHAQFAERGNSPTDIFTRLPPPSLAPASDGLGASSSRGSLDRERTSSPQLLPSPLATVTSASHPSSTPAHPPIAYKVLSPFKRSRASLLCYPRATSSDENCLSFSRARRNRSSNNNSNVVHCRFRASVARYRRRNHNNRIACGVCKPLRRAYRVVQLASILPSERQRLAHRLTRIPLCLRLHPNLPLLLVLFLLVLLLLRQRQRSVARVFIQVLIQCRPLALLLLPLPPLHRHRHCLPLRNLLVLLVPPALSRTLTGQQDAGAASLYLKHRTGIVLSNEIF